MGDTITITITPLHLAILSGIAGLAVALFGGIAKLFWNRLDRYTAEQNERMDRHAAEQNERMDRAKAEVIALVKQSDERNEKRFEQQEAKDKERDARNERHFREIRAELRDLNTRVSRLEGPMGGQGGSAGQSGQHSPQRDDDPASAPDGGQEPVPVVSDFDQAMVPPAGGRAEPPRAAGLAHQAVPGPQPGGETDPESQLADSPDTDR